MIDQGPFIMSRFACRDHLQEAMRRRIVELESQASQFESTLTETMRVRDARISELEQDTVKLADALIQICALHNNESKVDTCCEMADIAGAALNAATDTLEKFQRIWESK